MADGRKANGGKRSNAGRPSKAEEAGLHLLLDECWTDDERRKCIRALVAKTKPGKDFSLEAVKLLLAYAYGKPVDRQEITGANAEPVQVNIILETVDKVYGSKP